MTVKCILILYAHIFLIQSISAQSIGVADSCGYTASWGPAPIATASCTWGTSYSNPIEWTYAPASALAASNGPGVAVSSTSTGIPVGVSFVSENAYEGILAASGAIPFLGTVALEGALPTCGAGAISYACDNAAMGITAEDMGYGFNGVAGFAGASAPIVYGSGIGYGPCGYTLF